jgi:hypothetical protein
MGMVHKAFAFDWEGFERDELPATLFEALRANKTSGVVNYIKSHLSCLKDPYEGEPLTDDWQSMLENHDVHELGDFALTRFYNPLDDFGIWDQWRSIYEQLPETAKSATLGFPFGPELRTFDPGRYGAYFQTPEQIKESLALLERVDLPLEDYQQKSFDRFIEGLKTCVKSRCGLYVTF